MATDIVSITPEANLSWYLREIRKFPLLSLEEELALLRVWRDRQCTAAAHRLASSHLRLVVKIARGYRGYGLPVGELIGEGNIGLMQALQRFDPDRGFRFASYAIFWIRASIQQYILHSWSLVKIGTTAAQKKLFFNLRRLKGSMQTIEASDLSPEQVARINVVLDVPKQEIISMNYRLSGRDHSLNVPAAATGPTEWQDCLVDGAESPETTIATREELSVLRSLLPKVIQSLTDRERHILTERRLKDTPTSLDTLSRKYGISRERVRQIEIHAFRKVQAATKSQLGVVSRAS